MCNNQLFLFALDGLLPRSTIQEVFILRQVCKQGQEKIDKVIQQGVDTKESKHFIRSSMHLYRLYFSFYDYKFELEWTCYPWYTDVNLVCCDTEDCCVVRQISLGLYTSRKPHDYGAIVSFPMTMLKKAYPEFRPFYGDQVCYFGHKYSYSREK